METYFYTAVLVRPTTTTVTEHSFLDRLVSTTSSLLDIDISLLYEPCRRPRVKFARWIVWEVMAAIKKYSLKDCGRIFGDFDHTTVVHGLDRLPEDLKQNEFLNLIYNEVLRQMKVSKEAIIDMRNLRAVRKIDRLNRTPQIHF